MRGVAGAAALIGDRPHGLKLGFVGLADDGPVESRGGHAQAVLAQAQQAAIDGVRRASLALALEVRRPRQLPRGDPSHHCHLAIAWRDACVHPRRGA